MKLLSEGIQRHMGHNTFITTNTGIIHDLGCIMEAYFGQT